MLYWGWYTGVGATAWIPASINTVSDRWQEQTHRETSGNLPELSVCCTRVRLICIVFECLCAWGMPVQKISKCQNDWVCGPFMVYKAVPWRSLKRAAGRELYFFGDLIRSDLHCMPGFVSNIKQSEVCVSGGDWEWTVHYPASCKSLCVTVLPYHTSSPLQVRASLTQLGQWHPTPPHAWQSPVFKSQEAAVGWCVCTCSIFEGSQWGNRGHLHELCRFPPTLPDTGHFGTFWCASAWRPSRHIWSPGIIFQVKTGQSATAKVSYRQPLCQGHKSRDANVKLWYQVAQQELESLWISFSSHYLPLF